MFISEFFGDAIFWLGVAYSLLDTYYSIRIDHLQILTETGRIGLRLSDDT